MATGWPMKTTYADGDVFSASDINDTNGTINLIKPTAKGDLFAGSAANTYTKLAVGANDTVLIADTTAATGMKWGAPGGITLISEVTASAVSAIDFTSISGSYKHLFLQWDGLLHSTTGSSFTVRLNNDSSAIYQTRLFGANGSTILNTAGANDTSMGALGSGGIPFMGANASTSSSGTNAPMGTLWIYNYASTSKFKQFQAMGGYYNGTAASQTNYTSNGIYSSTSAITELNIFRTAGAATLSNITSTSVRLYGVS